MFSSVKYETLNRVNSDLRRPEYLAKANLPDSVIKTIIGWESLEMVDIYKDIDDEDEIGKYCMDGEIVGQRQATLADL